MAKRNRNQTALFEVMSPGKSPEPFTARRVFQSPPFFKSFKWPSIPTLPSLPTLPSMPSISALSSLSPMQLPKSIFKRLRSVPSESDTPDSFRIEESRSVSRAARVEEQNDDLFADVPDVTFDREPTYPEPAISLKLDWLNTAIVLSGVTILVGVSVLLERHFTHRPPMLLSSTANSTSHKPAVQPSVIDLSNETGPIVTQDKDRHASLTPPPIAPKKEDAADGSRTLNLNYLVMQRYNDTRTAHDAADFLKKSGVACDVVKGLPRMATNPDWFYVVGDKGFGPHCRGSNELAAYLEQIHKASLAFAGKTKWKQFDPILYRWDDAAAKVAGTN